ncbi:MAG: hypothetical protein N2C14_06655 [Planctomycetales bacterium]
MKSPKMWVVLAAVAMFSVFSANLRAQETQDAPATDEQLTTDEAVADVETETETEAQPSQEPAPRRSLLQNLRNRSSSSVSSVRTRGRSLSSSIGNGQFRNRLRSRTGRFFRG